MYQTASGDHNVGFVLVFWSFLPLILSGVMWEGCADGSVIMLSLWHINGVWFLMLSNGILVFCLVITQILFCSLWWYCVDVHIVFCCPFICLNQVRHSFHFTISRASLRRFLLPCSLGFFIEQMLISNGQWFAHQGCIHSVVRERYQMCWSFPVWCFGTFVCAQRPSWLVF